MLSLQEEARKHTKKPVFLSSLCQAPNVTNYFNENALIAIFTSDKEALVNESSMFQLIKEQCRIDLGEKRFIIVDCAQVDGFGIAIKQGLEVKVEEVSPLMVTLAKETVKANPKLRAIIFECTELPPYSDAVREAMAVPTENGGTRFLPVFDSITASNACVASMVDNPLFGKNGWQAAWDGDQEDYKFGDMLSDEEKTRLTYDPDAEEKPVRTTFGK